MVPSGLLAPVPALLELGVAVFDSQIEGTYCQFGAPGVRTGATGESKQQIKRVRCDVANPNCRETGSGPGLPAVPAVSNRPDGWHRLDLLFGIEKGDSWAKLSSPALRSGSETGPTRRRD